MRTRACAYDFEMKGEAAMAGATQPTRGSKDAGVVWVDEKDKQINVDSAPVSNVT